MRAEKIEESTCISQILPYRSETVKTAIIEIKTHENRKIAHLLGSLLYDFLLSEMSDLEIFENFTSPLILPIPITNRKKRKRGWNQCELLASAMKKIMKKSRNNRESIFEIHNNFLQKKRENEDQVGKSRRERFKNLENCLNVRKPELIKNRNIIVIKVIKL